MKIEPGVYYDLPAEDYFKADGLNKSGMCEFLRSPYHYKKSLDAVRTATEAQIIGSAIHLKILEPERFPDVVIEQKAKTPKEIGGIISLHERDIEKIEKMYESVQNHSIARILFVHGKPEVSIFWDDCYYKFPCKARIDYLRTDMGLIVDLKSTQNAGSWAFNEDSWKFKYHLQAAWYLIGLEAVQNDIVFEEYDFNFIFVAVEKAEPFAINVFKLDENLMQIAQKTINEVRESYAECIKTNLWRSYPESIHDLTVPKRFRKEAIYD